MLVEEGKDKLNEVFTEQIAILRAHKYPEHVLEALEAQRNSVVAKASTYPKALDYWEFIPVIPFSIISFYQQINLIRKKGTRCYSKLNARNIANRVETPSQPYYIFSVSSYRSKFCSLPTGDNPRYCPLTVNESLAFCIQYSKFSRTLAAASYYESIEQIPGMVLLDDSTGNYLLFTWYQKENSSEVLYNTPICLNRACFL